MSVFSSSKLLCRYCMRPHAEVSMATADITLGYFHIGCLNSNLLLTDPFIVYVLCSVSAPHQPRFFSLVKRKKGIITTCSLKLPTSCRDETGYRCLVNPLPVSIYPKLRHRLLDCHNISTVQYKAVTTTIHLKASACTGR